MNSKTLAVAVLLASLPAIHPLCASEDSYEAFLADHRVANRADKSPAGQRRLDWWRDARFGMFIHWDISSVAAAEISWSKLFYDDTGENLRTNPRPNPSSHGKQEWRERWLDWFKPAVPGGVYDNLHKSFYPAMFDADRIVAQAKQAGMKYIVQVAKHHGGFSMWDSAFTDYDMAATPFKRDIIGEMAKACEKAGMKYGIYYSQRDWHHPDYGTERMPAYNEFMRNQLRELLERHPNISIIWFDSGGYEWDLWEGDALYRMIHRIRPDILINNRCGLPGDFHTPEQRIGAYDPDRDWESCMTFTGFWSWHGFQTEVIPYEQCLAHLIRCAGGNGNLLMNIGPMPTGEIDPREADRLQRVGQWLDSHGESIYGTHGGPYKPTEHLASTRKGRTIYLHLLHPEPPATLTLAAVPATLRSARLLGPGTTVTATAEGGSLKLTLPVADKLPFASVIALEFDQEVASIPAIDLEKTSP